VASPRSRIGRISVYPHHGAWWIYYRDGGRPVRRKVAPTREEAERIAAQVNAQLAIGAPTMTAFTSISVAELRRRFLDFHEGALGSSLGTVRRYRAATQHLEDFATQQPRPPLAHEVRPDAFAVYLRAVELAPNGHPNAVRRRLRDKGVRFILETCRSLYNFARKRHHLPPYAENPFAELPLDRMKVEDAKPIFVFDAQNELGFLRAAESWDFPIHLTLAKTGLRVGELVHLLIEEVDLQGGWLRVRSKAALGWRVKTGTDRDVPLLPEVVAVLRRVIGDRVSGPVFLRPRFARESPPLVGDARELERAYRERLLAEGPAPTRMVALRVARGVWRDAGAIKADAVRTSFIGVMQAIGHPEATCPKSWRHSFTTLLQDANVDPLIRQQTLGHRPAGAGGLGMTANYTHTRRETLRRQIEAALRAWPEALLLASEFAARAAS
jgi:integrase